MPMADQLTNVALGRRRNPDLRESIGQKQIQDMQSVPRVGLLLSYPHRANLGRIPHPKFVLMPVKHPLEPLGTDRRFYAHTGRPGKTSVKLLRVTVFVL